jgi:hypothetical protein
VPNACALLYLIAESLLRGPNEGPEGRLAEIDTGRKKIAAVLLAIGVSGVVPALLPFRRVIIPAKASCNSSRRFVPEYADMGIVIGPVLKRADGYSFDSWAAGEVVSCGYPYRRIRRRLLRAECRGICTGSHRDRDRLPDPR